MAEIQYFWRHPLAEQVREEGREEGRKEGRAQGRAQAILHILQRRHIDVPESVRECILASTDLDELGTWLDRSSHVTNAPELFVAE